MGVQYDDGNRYTAPMPVRKTPKGWTFGGATYSSKAKADRAYKAYLAKKHSKAKSSKR